VLDGNVLVLNQNYEPLNVCSARRALLLIFRGKAQTVEASDQAVRTVETRFTLPSVVRLENYVRAPRRSVVLSKRNILRRDGQQCQYCGVRHKVMTVDHIVPRRLGGPATWENLVCACAACNTKKGDHTPEKVGLCLRRQPKRPNNVNFIRNFLGVSDKRWKPYLFVD
jgi:5-methylcytosine-specific restriction endonuclease McrA